MQFLLVTPDDAVAIGAINAANSDDMRSLVPVSTADGRLVLSADLLTDCAPGGTWSSYADLLAGMASVVLDLTDFPVVALPAEGLS